MKIFFGFLTRWWTCGGIRLGLLTLGTTSTHPFAGFRRRSEADSLPVQDLPFLQQDESFSGLLWAAVWDCGGESRHEAGDQVVNLQKSSHSDGERRHGKPWQKRSVNIAGWNSFTSVKLHRNFLFQTLTNINYNSLLPCDSKWMTLLLSSAASRLI